LGVKLEMLFYFDIHCEIRLPKTWTCREAAETRLAKLMSGIDVLIPADGRRVPTTDTWSKNFNDRPHRRGMSVCQISCLCLSVKPVPRYVHLTTFRFCKMAHATAVLMSKICHFNRRYDSEGQCQCASLCQISRPSRCWDMTIFRLFFKWRPPAILCLLYACLDPHEKYLVEYFVVFVTVQNLIAFRSVVSTIFKF